MDELYKLQQIKVYKTLLDSTYTSRIAAWTGIIGADRLGRSRNGRPDLRQSTSDWNRRRYSNPRFEISSNSKYQLES